MSWNQLDLAFKKFSSRRVTSDTKAFYEEFGDVSLDIAASDIKTDSINSDPAQAVVDGTAQQFTLLVLTQDTTVANKQAWFAGDGVGGRRRNWISTKFGAGYEVEVYAFDASAGTRQRLFPTDPSDWFFDYVTGVVIFNGNIESQIPDSGDVIEISGYQYVGQFLDTALIGGGGGGTITVQKDGIAIGARDTVNFTGNLVSVTDNAGNGRVDIEILNPTAGDVDYTPIDPNSWSFASAVPDNVGSALDSLSSAVNALLPTRESDLIGEDLSYVGATSFATQAVLPSGLPAAWYTVAAAGDTINDRIFSVADPVFSLQTPFFAAGTAGTPSSYGQIDAVVNGSPTDQYDLTSGVVGANGIMEITTLETFNDFWNRAEGQLNITLTTQGYQTYAVSHTESGQSNTRALYYDNATSTPTFSSGLVVLEETKVSKFLSGDEYYGLGTQFRVQYTIDDLFANTYRPTGATRISTVGLATVDVDPSGIVAFNDSFVVDEVVTLNDNNESDLTPELTVNVNDTFSTNVVSQTFDILANLGLPVSTWGVVSTPTSDQFQDEDQRLEVASGTAFDSTTALTSGDARVRPGQLEYAGSGDARYERRITKATANNGTLTFGGLGGVGNLSPFGTGNLNILIQLEGDNLYYDLGRPVGDNSNGAGNGSSEADSFGGRNDLATSGNTIAWSVGTESTSNNGNEYRLIIILRNNSAPTLTSIAGA